MSGFEIYTVIRNVIFKKTTLNKVLIKHSINLKSTSIEDDSRWKTTSDDNSKYNAKQ